MDDFTSREERKSESIKRMQQLGLESAVIDDLILRDKIVCSDYGIIKDVPEEIKIKIEDWEKKYHNFVYHVIHSHVYNCEIYDCLSTSCYKEDWSYENKR